MFPFGCPRVLRRFAMMVSIELLLVFRCYAQSHCSEQLPLERLRASVVLMLREQNGLGKDTTVRIEKEPIRSLPCFTVFRVRESLGAQVSTDDVAISNDGRLYAQGAISLIPPDVTPDVVKQTFLKLRPDLAPESVVASPSSHSPEDNWLRGALHLTQSQKQVDLPYLIDPVSGVIVFGAVHLVRSSDEKGRIASHSAEVIVGAKVSKNVLVIFSDFECVFCAAEDTKLPPAKLLENDPQLEIIFRSFPLTYHKWALAAAEAALCVYRVRPGAYLQYRAAIFKAQSSITESNVNQILLSLAKQEDVSSTELTDCLADPSVKASISNDIAVGKQLEISAVPALFINGSLVLDVPEISGWSTRRPTYPDLGCDTACVIP